MSGSGDTRRSSIVFVHGFGSSAQCWAPLTELMRGDEKVSRRFDLALFDYPTGWLETDPNKRIPDHEEIANSLENFLDSEPFHGRELTLIGHSQGGLVIHTYLASMLRRGRGPKLDAIRQVITIATPHAGSQIRETLRRVVYTFFDNPQEGGLRPLNPQTAEVVRTVNSRIATTGRRDDSHWPIPVCCFGALEDNVVPPASAQGPFETYKALGGDSRSGGADHSTVLQPVDREDDRYRELVEVVLDPIGHPHVFEVEQYENTIRVRPESRRIELPLGEGRTIPVETENVCELKRTVRFARHNNCRDRFKIRYKAGRDSFLKAEISHPNEAGQLGGEYRLSGQSYEFLFTPRQDEPRDGYWLWLEIYNGFGAGRRDVHFHFGSPLSQGGRVYYRRLGYELDLSAYLAAGRGIPRTPAFYLHPEDPEDPECGEKCASMRRHGEPIPPDESPREGVWRWHLSRIDRGIADLFWEIDE